MQDSKNEQAPAEPAGDGRLYLTLSLLLERSNLSLRFAGTWPPEKWQEVRPSAIAEAIDPLFDDVADRKRHLFAEDALLDAESQPATVRFELPSEITWSTEGKKFAAELGRNEFFNETICRSFWFLHSNGSLSYHLSLELGYRHSLDDYYALAIIQKAIFPSEGTQWVSDEGGLRVRVDGKAIGLWDFIEGRFESDASALLGKPAEAQAGYWEPLVCAPPARNVRVGADGRARNEGAAGHRRKPYQHRAVFLFADRNFFGVLKKAQDERSVEVSLPPRERADGRLFYEHDSLAQLGAKEEKKLRLVFLAGFLRNIIDFLRQDDSEVADGTDPVYPSDDDEIGDTHFLVFANQHSVFEVVESSRSLDVGRDYIGTCPYLFLVHIMVFHDEALVRHFELEVKRLVTRLEDLGLTQHAEVLDDPKKMTALIQTFQDYSVTMFADVEKYLHLNVFRYDTEQDFYTAVEKARDLVGRRQHWDDVLSRLRGTIEDIRETIRKQQEQRTKRIFSAIGIFAIYQVLMDGAKLVQENLQPWVIGLANLALLGVFVWALYLWLRRRIKKLKGGTTQQRS